MADIRQQIPDEAVKAASTAAAATDPSLVVALSPNSPVPLPTLTKGTQGATGVTTQDLSDAGRNEVSFFTALPILTTATDALQSLTGWKANAAVVATTTPAVVTTAKVFRLESVVLTYVATATAGTAKVTLRAQPAGVVLIGSPAVASWFIGASAAVAGIANTALIQIPKGIEFAAGTGIGVSVVGLGATQAAAIVGYASVALHGREY